MRSTRSSAEEELGLPPYRGHTLAEKAALALLVLFIIGAMLGLFGDGPLSHADVTSADGRTHVEYQRFARRQAPQTVDITFPTQRGAESIELHIDREYLRRVQITEIFPEPMAAGQQQTGKLRFITDGSGQAMTVRLNLKPQHTGSLRAHFAVGAPNSGMSVQFEQLVYP